MSFHSTRREFFESSQVNCPLANRKMGTDTETIQPSSDESGSPSREETHPNGSLRLRQRWQDPVDAGLANLPLLACCFITGLLDTTMFQGKQTT